MTALVVLALLASAGGVASALIRWMATFRSPAVNGMARSFVWLASACNALFFWYGVAQDIFAEILVSTVWGAVWAYVLWRLYDRRVTAVMAGGTAAIYVACAAVAYLAAPDVAGWIAGTLGVVAILPQLWKTWRSTDTAGVGVSAWAASAVVGTTWCAFGFVGGYAPIAITSAFGVAASLGVILGTRVTLKPARVTEWAIAA
jgi:uncharacterized protein with PQ loop repeat